MSVARAGVVTDVTAPAAAAAGRGGTSAGAAAAGVTSGTVIGEYELEEAIFCLICCFFALFQEDV